MANPEPIPGDPLVSVGKTFADSRWTVTSAWFDWFLNLSTIVMQSARRLGTTIGLTAQQASIAATPLLAGTPGGRFRITVTLYIETAATVSSTLTLTIGFARNGVARTLTTAPITDGSATAVHSETFLVDHDPSVALTYAIDYVSVGATAMAYGATIITESMT